MNDQFISKQINKTNRIKTRKLVIILVKMVYDTMRFVFFRLWSKVVLYQDHICAGEGGQ